MNISMYEASVPLFVHSLQSLKAVLQKGQAHAEVRKFDPATWSPRGCSRTCCH